MNKGHLSKGVYTMTKPALFILEMQGWFSICKSIIISTNELEEKNPMTIPIDDSQKRPVTKSSITS